MLSDRLSLSNDCAGVLFHGARAFAASAKPTPLEGNVSVSVNGDGFGLGQYGKHPEPGLHREVRPVW